MAAGDRLPNGSYRLFNGILPKDASLKWLCLDVPGSVDARGTNLRLFRAGIWAGQYFHAYSNGAGAEQMLYAPAIGMAVDIQDQKMADGTPVRMWDSWAWSGTGDAPLAQTWDIIQTDKTMQITVQGKLGTYPLYKVLAHKDNAFCMESGGVGGEENLPVQLWHYGDALDQLWAFVPAPTFPDGIYAVHSKLDSSLVLSANGASKANGTMCTVYAYRPDANELVYKVRTDDKGITRFESALKQKFCLNVQMKSGDKDGTPVQHYTTNDDDRYSQWLVADNGWAVDTNMVDVPAYRIIPAITQEAGRCMDVADGSTRLSTQVRIWSPNDSDAQRFYFEPAEAYDTGLPVPSRVRAKWTGGTGYSNQEGTLFGVPDGGGAWPSPAWTCNATAFEVRYRTRTRKPGGNLSDWGAYRDLIYDGTGNRGWGFAWQPAVTSPSGGNVVAAKPIGTAPYDFGKAAYDRVDFQIEVRAFSESAGVLKAQAHGAASSGVVTFAYKPKPTLAKLMLGGDGLAVAYASDATRGGNRVKVEISGVGFGEAYDMGASGTVTVPFGSLKRIPADGARFGVKLTMWTTDGIQSEVSGTMAVEYGTQGSALNPTVKINGTSATMTGLPSGAHLYLLNRRGHSDRLVEIDPNRILMPFGVEWELFATYGSGSNWSVWHKSFDPVPSDWYRIDHQHEGEGIGVLVNDGQAPEFTPQYTPDYQSYEMTGRERPVIVHGKSVKAEWQLKGVLISDLANSRAHADAVAHMGYAVFRSPLGFWAQVYVTGLSLDWGDAFKHEISVSMQEVDL